MDLVAGLLALVSANRHRWLQILETSQTHGLEKAPQDGERCRHQPGNAPEGAALMTQLNRVLQLLWIKRWPLAAALAASIHQGSAPAKAITSQPFVGGAEADPCLTHQISQDLSVLNLSTQKPFPTNSCQSGIGVGMHGL